MKSIETDLYRGAFPGMGSQAFEGSSVVIALKASLHTLKMSWDPVSTGRTFAEVFCRECIQDELCKKRDHAVPLYRAHLPRDATMMTRVWCNVRVHRSHGAIMVYLGGENEEYEMRFSKGAVARASSITISPDYYRDYLQSRFGDIRCPGKPLSKLTENMIFPNFVDLLRKARAYQGRELPRCCSMRA